MSHSSTTHRDSWKSNWGFVLACIGSAVGMGNIWMFPTRVSKYGGGTFLLPYFLFVIIIGLSGVIGEMAFGRATRSGPIGAFGQAIASRGKNPKIGQAIGYLPVIGSLAWRLVILSSLAGFSNTPQVPLPARCWPKQILKASDKPLGRWQLPLAITSGRL